MKLVVCKVGNVALGSLVKFFDAPTLWQVQEHIGGFTRLQEFFDFVTDVSFKSATLTIVDSIEVLIVAGF